MHRVGTAELVARNPGAAALLRNKYTSTWSDRHIKPAGVHPTDDAVVFLALPGAVVAYSIEDGTMSLACAQDEGMETTSDTFPYGHPPFLQKIPPIKSSLVRALPAAPLVASRNKKRKTCIFLYRMVPTSISK